ncbi:MAG: VWA domain-containing protein, partial [Thiothrix sp.]
PLVISLDFSASMYAEDTKPNRLAQARFKLLDILNMRADAQNALLVFAGDAFVVTPLSDDRETIQEHVKNLSPEIMPVQGSLLTPAINRAVELLQQANMPQGSILLLTDGVNDVQAAQQAAQASYRQGYRVSILAFGSAEGAPVPRLQGGFLMDNSGHTIIAKTNLDALERIAQAGGGVMLQATQGESDLNTLSSYWQAPANELQQAQGRKADTWVNAGYWLLLPLLPLASLVFRRGWLVAVLVCFLLPQPQPVYAFSWQDLWKTPDQQAQQAFANGELARAQELFQDPAWKAAAAYKNADYARAAQLYATQEGVTAKYNYGNAQARLGNLQEAIKAYQQVLQQDPNHADARHNLALLQKALQPQNQPQNQPQQANQQQNPN